MAQKVQSQRQISPGITLGRVLLKYLPQAELQSLPKPLQIQTLDFQKEKKKPPKIPRFHISDPAPTLHHPRESLLQHPPPQLLSDSKKKQLEVLGSLAELGEPRSGRDAQLTRELVPSYLSMTRFPSLFRTAVHISQNSACEGCV